MRPLDVHIGKMAVDAGVEYFEQVGFEESHIGLGLGVAEAGVVLEHFDVVAIDHEARVKGAGKRRVLIAQPGQYGLDGELLHLMHEGGRDPRDRRKRAHTASVGASVTSADALVVLGRREQNGGVTVAKGVDGDFLAAKEFFDDDRVTGLAEALFTHNFVESTLAAPRSGQM